MILKFQRKPHDSAHDKSSKSDGWNPEFIVKNCAIQDERYSCFGWVTRFLILRRRLFDSDLTLRT
jgi:hypothetical protein